MTIVSHSARFGGLARVAGNTVVTWNIIGNIAGAEKLSDSKGVLRGMWKREKVGKRRREEERKFTRDNARKTKIKLTFEAYRSYRYKLA